MYLVTSKENDFKHVFKSIYSISEAFSYSYQSLTTLVSSTKNKQQNTFKIIGNGNGKIRIKIL